MDPNQLQFFLAQSKQDLKDVKVDLKDEIGLLRSDIQQMRAAVEGLIGHKMLSIGIVVGVSAFFSVLTTGVTLYFTHQP